MKEKAAAIVLAGGSGIRMNTALPKQFMELAGKPVIVYSLEQFEKSDLVSDIVVVCCADYLDILDELVVKNTFRKVRGIVAGGRTRQGSSFIGVKNCPPGTELVLIHDAARPFITEKMIEDTLTAAGKTGAAGVAIDMDDTVIVKKDDFIKKIPAREDLKRIQTPQGFNYKTILGAHECALKNGITDSTDDCGLVLAMGRPVKWVEGDVSNIKITTPADMFLAERFL